MTYPKNMVHFIVENSGVIENAKAPPYDKAGNESHDSYYQSEVQVGKSTSDRCKPKLLMNTERHG